MVGRDGWCRQPISRAPTGFLAVDLKNSKAAPDRAMVSEAVVSRTGSGVSGASPPLVYAREQWEIDLGRRELRSGGAAVPLGSRAFEIVEVLVRSASQLVTKD